MGWRDKGIKSPNTNPIIIENLSPDLYTHPQLQVRSSMPDARAPAMQA